MEKHELLSILYSERQRLAAKYTSPGWNYWVLFGALVSCVLYFLDLDPKEKFVLFNILFISLLIVFIVIIPIIFYIFFSNKNKLIVENKLTLQYSIKKHRNLLITGIILIGIEDLLITNLIIDKNTFAYSIILLIVSILLHIICFISLTYSKLYKFNKYSTIFIYLLILWNAYLMVSAVLKIDPQNWTATDFKFAVIIISFFTIIYFILSIRKSDLSNIDTLIDNTIDSENINTESILKLLRLITIDYSIDSLYEDKIKYFISKITTIINKSEELDGLLNEFENLKIDNKKFMPLLNEIKEKENDFFKIIDEVSVELINMSPLIVDAPAYIRNNNIKSKQLEEITKIFIEIGNDINKLSIEYNVKMKKISALLDKKKEEIEQFEKEINTCLNCKYNSLNCKDVCENI
jgi:hypothetical protein